LNRFDEKWVDQAENQDTTSEEPKLVTDENRQDKGKQNWDDPLREWLLGQHLLNVQSEGSVSHRLSHFPLWFGDRLVEISVALFSQQQASCGEEGIRHRRLVISLDTDHLGHLDITLNLANRHLRLCLTSENEVSTKQLALHLGELKNVLESYGWVIDEIQYVTDKTVDAGTALRAVVEHHIAQDSLSRLM
jgi:flagellar hook-length control protein FliK